jgi:hypothetical protein
LTALSAPTAAVLSVYFCNKVLSDNSKQVQYLVQAA